MAPGGVLPVKIRKSHSEHFSTAVSQKADVVLAAANGSFVPIAAVSRCSNTCEEIRLTRSPRRRARAMSEGTSRPSALAVLRLITSSNLVVARPACRPASSRTGSCRQSRRRAGTGPLGLLLRLPRRQSREIRPRSAAPPPARRALIRARLVFASGSPKTTLHAKSSLQSSEHPAPRKSDWPMRATLYWGVPQR